MYVAVVGVNHKTAPVEIRERLSFSEYSLRDAFIQLKSYPGLAGCVILSTCNRTEIYAAVESVPEGIEFIRHFLSRKSGVELAHVNQFTYSHSLQETVRHLLRVASGLDSMLLGETQILGQVRTAYQLARSSGATNKEINSLFHHAIATGKRVRTETGIDQHAVSISYAAVELARQIFGSLNGRSVLVVGAGKMSELTVKHLVANGVSGVIVSNRSYDRAAALAKQFDGRAVGFEYLSRYLEDADIIISCTAATHYVLHLADFSKVMQRRQGRQMMLVDIAVPRDIEPAVGDLPGVTLYDVDDLQNVVDGNLAERKRAATLAEAIIEEEVADFVHWLGTQFVVPTITALKQRGEEIKQKELRRALNRLGELSEHDRKVIGSLANSIVNQLLHDPVAQLKANALKPEGPVYTEATRTLFQLNADGEENVPELLPADIKTVARS